VLTRNNSPRRIQMVCCCGDRWLTASGHVLTLWESHEFQLTQLGQAEFPDDIRSLSYISEGLALVALSDASFRLCDITDSEPSQIVPLGQDDESALSAMHRFEVQVLRDGRIISGSSQWIKLWRRAADEWMDGVRCERKWKGPGNHVTCFAQVSDELVAIASNGLAIQVYQLSTGQCVHKLKGHGAGVSHLGRLSDTKLVSGSWDNTLRCWNLVDGSCTRVIELDGHVRGLAVGAGGRFAVAEKHQPIADEAEQEQQPATDRHQHTAQRKVVRVFSRSGDALFSLQTSIPHINALCTAPTGRLLIGGDSNNERNKGIMEIWF